MNAQRPNPYAAESDYGPFDPVGRAGAGGGMEGGYARAHARGANGRLHDPDASADERMMAVFEHATFFTWFLGLPLVVTLVLWLIKKDESPFVDDHGRESVNMQISLLLYSLLSTVLGFLTCGVGWALGGVALIAAVIFSILASMAAQRGEFYRYPAVIRFL